MRVVETFLIAVSLGLDAFSVALAVGSVLGRASGRQTFRLSFHFGLFQFLMPVIGWAIGQSAADLVGGFDHWVAFGLLFAIGLHMVIESFRIEREAEFARDPTRGWSLVGLSVATSIDAICVGVAMGIQKQSLLAAAVVIGIVAGAMTLVGLRAGSALKIWVGRWMETAGGVVLIGLGVKMLWI
jgi:putative Mn2+ efflux pump MntP